MLNASSVFQQCPNTVLATVYIYFISRLLSNTLSVSVILLNIMRRPKAANTSLEGRVLVSPDLLTHGPVMQRSSASYSSVPAAGADVLESRAGRWVIVLELQGHPGNEALVATISFSETPRRNKVPKEASNGAGDHSTVFSGQIFWHWQSSV